MDYTGKRLLLVANPSNYHVFNYICNVLVPSGLDITVYSVNGPVKDLKENYNLFYLSHAVKLVDGVPLVGANSPRYLFYLIKTRKKILSLGQFEYLHVFYLLHLIAPALFLCRKCFKSITCTFFGSDLYRTGTLRQSLLLPLLRVSNHITLITKDMFLFFVASSRKYNSLREKCKIIDVGNMFYKTIDRIRVTESKQSQKQRFGFDKNKLLVAIGYIGRREMQQYETVKAILELNQNTLNKIQLAIPVYKMTEKELNKLKELFDNSLVKCDYKIFTHFMGEEEVSRFRVMTDIFIHAQTSDALSNAMMEHLYAGSVVVNGEWLNYSSLDDNGIDYIKFKDFDNLGNALTNVVNNYSCLSQAASKNHDIVYTISSWDALCSKWLSNYD